MIKSIELENFKAFKYSGIIDLEKINILVGPNSSGKSSFIKSILALKNSIDSKENETALGLNEEMGSYESVVYSGATKDKITYNIYFDKDLSSKFNDRSNTNKSLVGIVLYNIAKIANQNNKETDVEDFIKKIKKYYRNTIIDNIKIKFSLMKSGKVICCNFNINLNDENKYEIYKDKNSYYLKVNDIKIDIPNLLVPNKFYFNINQSKIKQLKYLDENMLESISVLDCILNTMEQRIGLFTDKISYIGPLRNKLERTAYIADLKINSNVGSKGENTLQTILSMSKKEDDKEKQIAKYTKTNINKWLDEFDLAENIDTDYIGADNYSLIIKNKYTGIKNNIVDVGVGTSQLLPIIVESVNSKNGSTLIIEEPETHIHPKAQSKLGDLFVECVKGTGKKFIIETHSIFLVTQLQILIANKTIDANDIAVYYFEQDEDGSKAKRMNILDNGQFEKEWPSGFFDVHYYLGEQLFKLM